MGLSDMFNKGKKNTSSKKNNNKNIYSNLINSCCCGGIFFAINENNDIILMCDDCEGRYDTPDDVLSGDYYRVNEKTRPATIEEIKNKGWTKYIEKQNIKDNK